MIKNRPGYWNPRHISCKEHKRIHPTCQHRAHHWYDISSPGIYYSTARDRNDNTIDIDSPIGHISLDVDHFAHISHNPTRICRDVVWPCWKNHLLKHLKDLRWELPSPVLNNINLESSFLRFLFSKFLKILYMFYWL